LPTLRSRTTHFSKSSMSRLFGVQVVVTHVHWLISWCFPLIQLIVWWHLDSHYLRRPTVQKDCWSLTDSTWVLLRTGSAIFSSPIHWRMHRPGYVCNLICAVFLFAVPVLNLHFHLLQASVHWCCMDRPHGQSLQVKDCLYSVGGTFGWFEYSWFPNLSFIPYLDEAVIERCAFRLDQRLPRSRVWSRRSFWLQRWPFHLGHGPNYPELTCSDISD